MTGMRNHDHLIQLDSHTRAHVTRLLAAHPLLKITSSYRSPARNRRVGGVPNSYHLQRRAIDFLMGGERPADVLAFIRDDRVSARCTGPEELLAEPTHYHVAW